MKSVAKAIEPAERQARFDHIQPHYLEALTLIERLHRRLPPAGLAGATIEQRRGELVVAVHEDVGADDHLVARRPFDGKPSRVDFRMQALDDDTPQQAVLQSLETLGQRAGVNVVLNQVRGAWSDRYYGYYGYN